MARFGLLGGRLSHSLSPQIHKLFHGYLYDLFELPEEDVPSFLQKGEFDAINVTIPYKKIVMPFCKRLSPQAIRIGSVNTVRKEKDGTLSGFNTDYFGFSYLLRRAKIDTKGKKVLILGSGGSCVTVQAVLSDLGAREVCVISRMGQDNYSNLSRHTDTEIIVNTTPVGMYPQNGERPLSLDVFPRLEAVADIIYNPLKTALLQDAEARGLRVENGLSMLVAQAKEASEIFLDRKIPDTEIERVLNEITGQIRNIVLIGMPGCGKSTVAKRLGELLSRQVVDTDQLIEEKAGKSIPEIFESEGEEGFRKRESEAVEKAGKRLGIIIATGGGVVTRPENYAPLHQNGTILFLDRPTRELATKGRPLSSDFSRVEALSHTRLPLYCAWSDKTVKVQSNEEETAKMILKALKTP